jgi:hypothetical protein
MYRKAEVAIVDPMVPISDVDNLQERPIHAQDQRQVGAVHTEFISANPSHTSEPTAATAPCL